MKKSMVVRKRRVQSTLATLLAFAVVVGIPIVSFAQYTEFFREDPRDRSALPAFQTRTTDANPAPYNLFEEPLISVTFDDGWAATYTDAMPLLHQYGVRTTQYVLSGTNKSPSYLSWDQMSNIKKAGHEIGCHSDTHADLRLVEDKMLAKELGNCYKAVTKRQGAVSSFASPYGSSDKRTLSQIQTMFMSHRNTNGDSSNGVTESDVNLSNNFNPYNIIGMTIKRTTTVEEIKSLVDFTVANNGWLVLTCHQADDGGSEYAVNKQVLASQLEILNKAPARIVTVEQALNSSKR